MPNATTTTVDPTPGAKGHATMASAAARAAILNPAASSEVQGPTTVVTGNPSLSAMRPDSFMPKRKPKARAKVLLVRPLNHSQVRARHPTQKPTASVTEAPTTVPPPTSKGTTANLRAANNQGSDTIAASSSPKKATIVLRPNTAQDDVAGARRIPATKPSTARLMPRTGALGVKAINRQGSQPQAVRSPSQGPVTKPLPAQRPTANLRPAIAQASAGVRDPLSPKGPTTVLRPADTQGPDTTVAGGHRMPTAMPNSSPDARASATAVDARSISCQVARPPIQGPPANLRPNTIQASAVVPPPSLKEPTLEPTTMTTLNPAAPVFVPSSKGHKTLAAAATVNTSGDKKIPAPANNAGGRCIPAIRPPSARPVPKAGARADDVRPISRPPAHPQGSRPVAIEVRPISRQGFPAMPRPPTAQWPAMVQGANPFQGPITAQGSIAAPHPCSIQSQARVPPTAAEGTPSMPLPPTAQASVGGPTFVPMGTIDVPRPTTAQGSAVPQQGYLTPPEFRPVRPIIRPGRVEPFAHLFNGETPQDKVWPRTFGPGQPHTASIVHKLQDQEFLPQSGWWCWLPFEGRYDLMPYY